MTVDHRRLIDVVALADERRRAARGVLGRLEHPWARGLLFGVLGAALVAAIARGSSPAEARGWWVLACLTSAVTLVLGGPFRIYWRRDSTLLARLPIGGKELFRLASRLSLHAALGYLLALALAAAPLFLFVEPGPVLRLEFMAIAMIPSAMAASVAAATVAGAVVVSAKTQALIRDLSSGQAATGTVWLSLVPAGFAFAIAYTGYLAATAERTAVMRDLLAGMAAAATAVFELTQHLLAARVLADATREVAALDAVRLAHVDLSRARGLERAWGQLAGAARSLYEKDVAVMRRRHPGFYLLTGLGVMALWLVAFLVDEPQRTHVVLGGTAALAAYVLLAARRLTVPPIEQPRLLATLPLPPRAVAHAKSVHVAWRALWAVVLAGAPTAARSPRPLLVAAGLAAIAVVTMALGGWLVRRD